MAAQGSALYHMCQASAWRAAESSRTPYFPATYSQDGFIHLSADPGLLLTIANHFYTESEGEWTVLVLDPARLSAEVKFEPAAPVGDKSSGGLLAGRQQGGQQQQQGGQQQQRGSGEAQQQQQHGSGEAQQQQQHGSGEAQQQQQGEELLFPHLYGSIDFAAVVRELPMQRGPDGTFLGIEGLA